MIFKVLKIRNMAREARENPGKFAAGEAGEFFIGFLILPIISAVLLLGGLFILGFTSWLGGPFGFFKVLFFFILFGAFAFFWILRKVYMVIKGVTKGAVDQTIKVDSKVVE